MAGFRLPDDSQRAVVIGRTGSGKTQFGVWLLSLASYDVMPWIIFDFKGDDLIKKIRPQEISIHDAPPLKAGLYVVRPIPKVDEIAVEKFLWQVWRNGNTGLYFDEGYMVAKSEAYGAIMTQGRSLRIPAITLTQRPVFANPFTFSESDFFAIFQLNKKDDNKKVSEYTLDFDFREKMPRFQSRWFDVGQGKIYNLLPAPNSASIIQSYKNRIKPKMKVI
jgi:hypothetical protein